MKLVIGIVGPPLAGKGTVAEGIAKLLTEDNHTVSVHRFSDILRETLDLWGLPHGRTNEQMLAQLMVAPDFFGPGTLSNAMKTRLMKNIADVGILEGVRWFSDETMIRSLSDEKIKNVIIHVTASDDRRYERLSKRNRSGESATTREEFDRQGKARNEIYIPEIGSRADLTITNEYENTEDLRLDIEKAYRTLIAPLL